MFFVNFRLWQSKADKKAEPCHCFLAEFHFFCVTYCYFKFLFFHTIKFHLAKKISILQKLTVVRQRLEYKSNSSF